MIYRVVLFRLSTILSIIALFLFIYLLISYIDKKEIIHEAFKQDFSYQGCQLANDIDASLKKSEMLAENIKVKLMKPGLTDQVLIGHLHNALNTNSNLLGIGVAYKPNAYDPVVRLFAPYILRQSDSFKRIQIENLVDYSIDKFEWFSDRLKDGAEWNEVRYSEAAEQNVVEYAVPFTQLDPVTGKQKVVGLIIIHYALDYFLEKINSINMGKADYGILLSKKLKTLVSPVWNHDKEITTRHGIKKWVKQIKINTSSNEIISSKCYEGKLNDIVDESEGGNATNILNDDENEEPMSESIELKTGVCDNNVCESILYKELYTIAESGNGGVINEIVDPNNLLVLGDVYNIPTTGWTLAMLYSKDELIKGNRSLRQHLTWIFVSIILFVLMLIIMELSLNKERSVIGLGIRASVISALFTMGIVLVWYLSIEDIEWKNFEPSVIKNQNKLDEFEKQNIVSALKERTSLPIYIPTGVFVQSIEFTSANNVVLTGYIWQQYNNFISDEISRGFVLPEAESLEKVESYRRIDNNSTLIGWYFRVVLRQEFDYSQYPFDQQTVWIRLWHEDFDKNVILTPALNSYDQLHPEKLPGIEKDFVLPGWKVTSSYYKYRLNSYNTDFGIPRYIGKNEFPELYFQIGVKRLFLNPFISNLTPVIVVLLMLFAVLITSSKKTGKIELLGFNASTILASSSALFFVVLISHIDLRSSLAANNIFYMEYFYVVTYLSLLAISVNSILFSWGANVSFVQFRDNLLPKLYFWPVITFVMFLVTIWKFY